MRRRNSDLPQLKIRDNGYAYCHLNGKQVYLGKASDPETLKRYQQILHAPEVKPIILRAGAPSVQTLCDLFLVHADEHYRRRDGTHTSEYRSYKWQLALLTQMHGQLVPGAFRPSHLKEFRQSLLDRDMARTTINQCVGRIRHLFNWAVGEDLLEAPVAMALSQVPDLAPGRSRARESDPVPPVDEDVFMRTLPHLLPHYRAMAIVQWWCGARPGEVCRMRPSEVVRDGIVRIRTRNGTRAVSIDKRVWAWQPERTKTGGCITYFLPPPAQEVLAPWLLASWMGGEDAYAWSPRLVCLKRKLRPHFDASSYSHAVNDAARQAGVEIWSPNQIRHSFLSRMDQKFGLQIASISVGHASMETTQIYAEKNLAEASAAVANLASS